MAITKFNRIAIEFHVPDLRRVKTFYKKLGFKIISEAPIGKNPGYLVLKIENSFLNFYGGDDRVYGHAFFANFPRNTKRGYEVETTIIINNIKKYYKSVSPKIKNNIAQPLTLKRWGKWDFRIVDPFGFYIRFTEPVPWLDSNWVEANNSK